MFLLVTSLALCSAGPPAGQFMFQNSLLLWWLKARRNSCRRDGANIITIWCFSRYSRLRLQQFKALVSRLRGNCGVELIQPAEHDRLLGCNIEFDFTWKEHSQDNKHSLSCIFFIPSRLSLVTYHAHLCRHAAVLSVNPLILWKYQLK